MKLLVLIDGSMWSHKAAMYALQLARKKEAEIVLFSVLDKRESKAMAFNFCTQSNMCDRIENYESQIWRDMRRSINDEMTQMLIQMGKQKISATSRIVEGNIAEEVVKEANGGGYSLIIMGASGKQARSTLSKLFVNISNEVDIPLFIAH